MYPWCTNTEQNGRKNKINWCLQNISTFVFIVSSKVGDRSRGWPEGPLFNSYNTEVSGGATPLLLIRTLYCWVLSKELSSTILKSLVWRDWWLNPRLPDHWRTLYSLGQWAVCIHDIWKHSINKRNYFFFKAKSFFFSEFFPTNVHFVLFRISSSQRLFWSHKNTYFEAIQNGGQSNTLKQALPSNLSRPRSGNNVKFTEKFLMCTEKRFLIRNTFTNGKIWVCLNESEWKTQHMEWKYSDL